MLYRILFEQPGVLQLFSLNFASLSAFAFFAFSRQLWQSPGGLSQSIRYLILLLQYPASFKPGHCFSLHFASSAALAFWLQSWQYEKRLPGGDQISLLQVPNPTPEQSDADHPCCRLVSHLLQRSGTLLQPTL